jgi:hypothetical protein
MCPIPRREVAELFDGAPTTYEWRLARFCELLEAARNLVLDTRYADEITEIINEIYEEENN